MTAEEVLAWARQTCMEWHNHEHASGRPGPMWTLKVDELADRATAERLAKALRVLEAFETEWAEQGLDDPQHRAAAERHSRASTLYTAEDVLLNLRAALEGEGEDT